MKVKSRLIGTGFPAIRQYVNEIRAVSKAHQAYAEFPDSFRHAGVRQCAHLCFPFFQVDRAKIRRNVSGMAGEFGPSWLHFSPKNVDQSGNAHVIEVGYFPFPLGIKTTDESH